MQLASQGGGTINIRGRFSPTAYDPILNTIGHKPVRIHSAASRRTVLSGNQDNVYRAYGRGRNWSGNLTGVVPVPPSLPRRNYQPSVLY
jgi:hypothetical protein